jgi:membrane protease YdiL (CAAX protease family)
VSLDPEIPQPPPAAETPASARAERRLLAPVWHTAILVAVLLLVSVSGAGSHHLLARRAGKLPQYLWGMGWEWMLAGFVWLGIRKRYRLRDIIGGRWASFDDFFLDVLVAALFWAVAAVVLASGAKLMHLDQAEKLDAMRRQLGFLTPNTRLELGVWFLLSTTAGICEEFIFRGYLQLQFAALTRSMLAGALLSAVIFGASHGYEGGARMLLIGIFGLLFGLLAWWRRSLRPGMIAHAWHDALSGALLRMMK